MRIGLLLSSFWVLLACQTEDPQAALLPGRWEFVESTDLHSGQLYKTNAQYQSYLTFTGSGKAGELPESYPVHGGWCNEAKAYTYAKNELRFTFGEPQCIPLVPPQVSEKAVVIDLTRDDLLIEWQATQIRYKRVQ